MQTKPNKPAIHLYSKEEKERYVSEYRKISDSCSVLSFARDNGIKPRTFYGWLKNRANSYPGTAAKPIDIMPMFLHEKEEELIPVVLNGVRIETNGKGLRAIIGELAK